MHKKFQEDTPNSARVTAAKENLDPDSENLCANDHQIENNCSLS